MIGVEGPAYPFCCSILYLSVHRITGTETLIRKNAIHTHSLCFCSYIFWSWSSSLKCQCLLTCLSPRPGLHAWRCVFMPPAHVVTLPIPVYASVMRIPMHLPLLLQSLTLSLLFASLWNMFTLINLFILTSDLFYIMCAHTYMVRSRSQKMVHMSIHSHVRLIITQSSIKVYVNQSINHVRDSQGSHFGVGPENI